MLDKTLKHAARIAGMENGIAALTALSKIAVLHEEAAQKLMFNYDDSKLKFIFRLSHLTDGALIRKYVSAMFAFKESQPDIVRTLTDSISSSQMVSKAWILDTLETLNLGNLGNVLLCGGWYASILFDGRLQFNRCISADIDTDANKVAERLNDSLVTDNWKFKAVNADLLNINGRHEFTLEDSNVSIAFSTIINTSCEHISRDDFSKWWECIIPGKLVIVQSNNAFDVDGHVNCCDTLSEFSDQTPMSKVYFSSEKDVGPFTRFMRIGIR